MICALNCRYFGLKLEAAVALQRFRVRIGLSPLCISNRKYQNVYVYSVLIIDEFLLKSADNSEGVRPA